jgi:multimeric flavodoxin WrbA
MKILAINGSPRVNGNTASLMKLVIDEAKTCSSEVNVMWCNLNDMTYAGCQSCLTCKTSDVKGCVRKDALSFVLDVMLASQAWIIGTPIYMGQASGQLKLLLDRMYGFTGPNKQKRIPPGKKAIVAITQEASEGSHDEVPTQMKNFFIRRGLDTEVIRACDMSAAAPSAHFGPEIYEEARRLGKWLTELKGN